MLTQKPKAKLKIIYVSLISLLGCYSATTAIANPNQSSLNQASNTELADNDQHKGHTVSQPRNVAPPRPAFHAPTVHANPVMHNPSPPMINRQAQPMVIHPQVNPMNTPHGATSITQPRMRTNTTHHEPTYYHLTPPTMYNPPQPMRRHETTTHREILTTPSSRITTPQGAATFQGTTTQREATTFGGTTIRQGTTTFQRPSTIPHHGIQPSLHYGPTFSGTAAISGLSSIHTGEQKPLHVVKNIQPSHLSNNFTQKNLQSATRLNHQFVSQPNNSKWTQDISGYKNQYRQRYHNNDVQHFKTYSKFWHNHHFHDWYSFWYPWGFYGGFWYPVRPSYDIEDYFDYPDVQWLYADEPVTPDYYNSYYPSESTPPSVCLEEFPYKHIYYPTDTMRDLLVEVSGLPQDLRCNFRAAIINFTSDLQQDAAEIFSRSDFSFNQNDVVVNYYQNLQNQAIVIAGFVSNGNINMAFEGLLDLENPDQSITFAPQGQTPSEDELEVLNELNERIQNLGGDPFTAQQEPETAPQQLENLAPGGAPPETAAPGP